MFQLRSREGSIFPLDLDNIRRSVTGQEPQDYPVAGEGHLQITGTREFEGLFGNLSTCELIAVEICNIPFLMQLSRMF